MADRKIEARLGAVYSLESLATDAGEERTRAVETLCAFLRSHGRPPERETDILQNDWIQPEDVQAAFTVVCRMPNVGKLDLRRAHLSNIEKDEESSNLEGALFEGATLRGVNFTNAKLRGAQFRGADLRDAIFPLADLRDANLSKAIVGGCWFISADMRRARLWGVDLREAELDEARLEGAMYDDDTKFPAEFSPDEKEMQKIDAFE